MRRFFSTPRRCGRRTWTTPLTPPTPTPTATTMKNTWCLSRACVDARVGSGVCIYYSTSSKDVRSSSSRNVFDVNDEDKVYAAEKTFSGEFKGEKFRAREWLHPEEFRRERDSVRDESVRRGRDDGRRGNGAARVEVVRAVRRRYGRESKTGFDVVDDEKRKR